MSTQYPSSQKVRPGGIAYLVGRIIGKIRLRHTGQIQDYNYLTVGFDRYLLDFLELDASAFEQRVLDGGTDTEFLDWVCAHMRCRSSEKIAQWNQRIETSGPTDKSGKIRFQHRLNGVAQKRRVPVSTLPHITTIDYAPVPHADGPRREVPTHRREWPQPAAASCPSGSESTAQPRSVRTVRQHSHGHRQS
jgi:hypothetical protein